MAITIIIPTPEFPSSVEILSLASLPVFRKFTLLKRQINGSLDKLVDWRTHFLTNTMGFGSTHNTSNSLGSRLFGRSPMGRRNKLIAVGILLLLLISGAGYKYFRSRLNVLRPSTQSNSNQPTSKTSNLGEMVLNRSYTFSGKNAQGVTSGEVKFTITKVEKAKEVLVQGRPANAKGDKAFLVLNIEIENAAVVKAYITPVDLLRLIGDDGKKFAPDIHSDVVEVQPISTKITRVGFVIFEKQKDFKIQVGELNGEKEVIDVSL